MKINKFKKISSNKYKIFFDNHTLIIYEDVILKYNLLYKKDIDSNLLLQINEDNYKASIYDTALKYINVRMRSKKEMYEYLIKKGYDYNNINDTIQKLLDQNLLNDIAFCKSYINDKINLTNSGLDKIKNELLKLGIEEDVIDESFNNIDKSILNDKLIKIIDKELKINSKLPLIKLKNKIINRCINLGYNYDSINEILNNTSIISNSNIKKEYDIYYKKYKDKYEGYKLETFIKSKLYQKGYSSDEINKIFEN